jgi:hypothetical protein
MESNPCLRLRDFDLRSRDESLKHKLAEMQQVLADIITLE